MLHWSNAEGRREGSTKLLLPLTLWLTQMRDAEMLEEIFKANIYIKCSQLCRYCMFATLLEFCHSHISTYVHMSCAHLFKTTFPIFPSTSTFNSNISAFSGCEGRLARSLGLCIHSRECQNLILIVELQFCNFSLSLSAVFLFQLLCLYVSAW